MWCPRCRQDVPAIAAPFEQTLCCARCRQSLSAMPEASDPPSPGPASLSGVDRPANRPNPANDLELLSAEQQAELDSILTRAEWLLGIPSGSGGEFKPAQGRSGFHPPHKTPSGHHSGRQRESSRQARPSRIMMASWSALAVALTGFVCGGILLAWSLISNRPELWNVGETVTLASQVGLLIGLILQLERLGHDRHQTVNRLTLLDERVESLRNSGVFWSQSATPSGERPAGRGPESLLADLKSQLDHLANRLGEKRSA